jgi:hypothetical protein
VAQRTADEVAHELRRRIVTFAARPGLDETLTERLVSDCRAAIDANVEVVPDVAYVPLEDEALAFGSRPAQLAGGRGGAARWRWDLDQRQRRRRYGRRNMADGHDHGVASTLARLSVQDRSIGESGARLGEMRRGLHCGEQSPRNRRSLAMGASAWKQGETKTRCHDPSRSTPPVQLRHPAVC